MVSDHWLRGRILPLVFILWVYCFRGAFSQKQTGWKTLSGKVPLVIAHGGLSGLYPDQTVPSYLLATNNSLVSALMYCDLQLTKDALGICRTNLDLDNSTDVSAVYANQTSTYVVNGNNLTAYYSSDFTLEQLQNLSARQTVTSRPVVFDNIFPLIPPEALPSLDIPITSIWLNVQYPNFYEERNLSVAAYLQSLTKAISLEYISSSEVGFLRDIAPRFKNKSKLIFRFLGEESVEPSTKQTYGSILKNLTFVKTFAAGILVPKTYILPVGVNLYLTPPTDLVKEAHNAGLEIFASDFANDEFGMSYNYSYDPIKEYLQFVDNGDFAVDGVLTDFPLTASEAIACYAQNNRTISSKAGKPLIISHNGASGDYPGCTDIAYEAAIRDGADYIDCSVQITKDGVPFCRESINLMNGTDILTNSVFFPSRSRSIPAIQDGAGIFTFDLTWKEIESLKPNIFSPYDAFYNLKRNPAEANVGKYMNLTAFLEFAKKQDNIGVLINIEFARVLISEAALDVTNTTISALQMAGYDNTSDRVMIQSDDSAVLLQFKQRTKFKLVYTVDNGQVTIPDSTIKEIKGFADTVAVSRKVIYEPNTQGFLERNQNVVHKLHHHNVSVFVTNIMNEFPSMAFDFQADPTLQIHSFVQLAKVDGLITDFPETAAAYFGNACLQPQTADDYPITLVSPGGALTTLPPGTLPPALAPFPALSDVLSPALPAVEASSQEPASSPSNTPESLAPGSKHNSACQTRHSFFVSILMGLFILFFNSC